MATNPFRLWELYRVARAAGQPISDDVLTYFDRVAESLERVRTGPIKNKFPGLVVRALEFQTERGKRIPRGDALEPDPNRIAWFVYLGLVEGKTLTKAYLSTAALLGVSRATVRRGWIAAGRDWQPPAVLAIVRRSKSGRLFIQRRTDDRKRLVTKNRQVFEVRRQNPSGS